MAGDGAPEIIHLFSEEPGTDFVGDLKYTDFGESLGELDRRAKQKFLSFAQPKDLLRLKNQIVAPEPPSALLVVHVPASKTYELWQILVVGAINIRSEVTMLEYGGEEYFPYGQNELEVVLAVAELHCLKGGDSLIVVRRDSSQQPSWVDKLHNVGPMKPLFGFRIHLMPKEGVPLPSLGPLLGAKECALATTEVCKRDDFSSGDRLFGPYQYYPESEQEIWYALEFSDELVREEARHLVRELQSAEASDPAALERVVLTALRVARRLTTRTLEGTPYECTLLLAYDKLSDTKRKEYHEIFPLRKSEGRKVYLNFKDWDDICDFTEMAQAIDTRIVVDIQTGELLSLVAHHPSGSEPTTVRHLRFADEASKTGLLIHVRDRFVEVYRDPPAADNGTDWFHGMRLWFDGFRWHRRPFQKLRHALQKHVGHKNKSAMFEVIRILEGAVSIMLDRSESSIFVLLNDNDQRDLKKLLPGEVIGDETEQGKKKSPVLTRMRELRHVKSGQVVEIANLTSQSLAGLLHLDGAHFIQQDMTIRELSLQVVGADQDRHEGGSGRAVAQFLQDKLRESQVVKVSASGGLRFFQPKRLQPQNGDQQSPLDQS